MNRGPIILTIDEAEYLIDQLPPPSADDDEMIKKLRKRLQELLAQLRAGAEGVINQQTIDRVQVENSYARR